jgi:hypothetical protein
MAVTLTSQQSAMLAAQKTFDLQNDQFQTDQSIESGKAKESETNHDAHLAIINGMNGR